MHVPRLFCKTFVEVDNITIVQGDSALQVLLADNFGLTEHT